MKCVKIIQINGVSLQIEDEACDRLSAYMESLEQYFSNEPGADEIIADIEARIEELFTERPGGIEAVVTAEEVARVIATLGTVEDFAGNAAGARSDAGEARQERSFKRIYRDTDNRYVGGVCAGIAHWTGIHATVIRLFFVLMTLLGGISVLLYLVLYIIIPPARNRAQKLEMTGQPVNINTIERSVKESIDIPALRQLLNRFSKKAGVILEKCSHGGLRVLGIVLGCILCAGGLLILVAPAGLHILQDLVFAHRVQWELLRFEEILPRVISPLSFLLLLVSVGTALLLLSFACFFWGIWLIKWFKIRRAFVHVILLIVLIVALSITTYVIITEVHRRAYKNEVRETSAFPVVKTLYIEMQPGAPLANFPPLDLCYDKGNERFHKHPYLSIARGDSDRVTLQVTKRALGKNKLEAHQFAGDISYNLEMRDSLLLLPEFFDVLPADRWNYQTLALQLFVPVGTVIVTDKSISRLFMHSRARGSRWKMTENELELLR
ncbi:MAG: PspC domain-containing protein, partial [Odoribacteraceae bacterium]|jgi:phage shock protein PspC (stress-responsive transcriptional regulator)|nr:PspC domain-containing protein [Odoribacteraceae bacterium]